MAHRKQRFILLCLTAYAAGQVVVEPVRQEEAPPQPYSFRYDTTDEFGSRTTREETSDENNNKVGSYSYVDANGISRTVRYVADAEGFHVTIETNEPGTRTSNPAQAQITSTAVEPPPEAAPVAVQALHGVPAGVVVRSAPTAVTLHAAPVDAVQAAPVAVHAGPAAVHAAPVTLHAAPISFATAQLRVPVSVQRKAKSR